MQATVTIKIQNQNPNQFNQNDKLLPDRIGCCRTRTPRSGSSGLSLSRRTSPARQSAWRPPAAAPPPLLPLRPPTLPSPSSSSSAGASSPSAPLPPPRASGASGASAAAGSHLQSSRTVAAAFSAAPPRRRRSSKSARTSGTSFQCQCLCQPPLSLSLRPSPSNTRNTLSEALDRTKKSKPAKRCGFGVYS
jgi:hypothetical protein